MEKTKSVSKKSYKIPWNNLGPMQWDEGGYWMQSSNGTFEKYPIMWKDNSVFYKKLACTGYGKGRSSVTFVFTDDEKITYYMFLSDLYRCIRHLEKGTLSGYFTFVKKGTNYGIQYLGVNEVKT